MPPSNPQTNPQPSIHPHAHKKQALILSVGIILVVLIAGILLYRYNKLHLKDRTEENAKMLLGTIPEGQPSQEDAKALQATIPKTDHGTPSVKGPTTPPPSNTNNALFDLKTKFSK